MILIFDMIIFVIIIHFLFMFEFNFDTLPIYHLKLFTSLIY